MALYLCTIFQSTRSQRPRPDCSSVRGETESFQSTRSQRPRRDSPLGPDCGLYISIHEVAKTSTAKAEQGGAVVDISIHEVAKTSTAPFFTVNGYLFYISIHEVAKTSTLHNERQDRGNNISIHEVAKTSTFSRIFPAICLLHFNPRGRKDLDGRIKTALKRKDISIHEVAKTSTTISSSVLCSTIYFNPRGRKDLDTVPHHGRKAEGYFNPRGRKDLDTFTRGSDSAYRVFQSTRSQRPRRYRSQSHSPAIHFNPRGRKDLDVLPMHLGSFPLYFNPRGRKDLDSQRIKNYKNSNISIHEVAKTSTANPSKNPIPSPAKSISIIQPPHDYFHQIIISTLYFIHFSPKTGANPPANPWELTVRTN